MSTNYGHLSVYYLGGFELKSNHRIVVILAVMCLVVSGCSLINNRKYDRELKSLLPGQSGFEWTYFGFAEYDHRMILNTIETQASATRYAITGEVGDPSGGESQRDLTLQITYIIEKGVWVQEKVEEAMMDSEFDRLEILRGPLQKGAKWTQKQVDKHGQTKTLDCTIEDIRTEQGLRTFVVLYRDKDSAYYEKREIVEAKGIRMFEKLYISPEGNFEIGYQLYEGQ